MMAIVEGTELAEEVVAVVVDSTVVFVTDDLTVAGDAELLLKIDNGFERGGDLANCPVCIGCCRCCC